MRGVVLDGTVRARTPGQTWQALEPELERLGITRVARLTGLDCIGIPVWTAIRPSSRTLVASQGKGATDELAKISAVLEGAELWHAEQPMTAAVHGSHHGLGVPYPMDALPVKVGHEDLRHLDLAWTEGTGLISGQSVLVPADLARWRSPCGDVPLLDVFHVTTNGLACGNTLGEATLHALFEVIERDVLHRDYTCGGRQRTLVDPRSVEDRYCRDLIERLLDAGMALEIALVDSAYEIPVCAAYIWSEDYPVAFAGAGCHRDPHIALSRALTEAAQSRLTGIAGTRDNLESREDAFASRPARPEPSGPGSADWATITARYTGAGDGFTAETAAVSAQVAAVTGHEPVVVTLHESDAYAAVKIVSPGAGMRIHHSLPHPGKHHG
ncbi:YcaO-like family protein [Streptomyces syringium]|uniref:YcaO-like family protein n=1 Tax=Streptomyces syringium TaxID=76729 RepID=UPI0037D4353B